MARAVFLVSLKLCKPTLFSIYYPRCPRTNYSAICTSSNIFTLRSYCQKSLEMIVEFEQVKRATADSTVYIIDVREPDEIKEHGKIPNSINIPLGSVETALQMSNSQFQTSFKRKKPAADSEILFYCMVGKRSAKAQEYAQKIGFQNVKNYLGSFNDWAAKSKGYV